MVLFVTWPGVFSSTLRYLNANCSWRVTVNIEGNVLVIVGPQRTLDGGDGDKDGFTLK